MFLSQLKNLIYFFMVMSMVANAGLIGVIFPITVFGYAMLEETRPSKAFFHNFIYYTMALLFVKFTWNLSLMESVSDSTLFMSLDGYLRMGLYDYDDLFKLTMYMLPELVIVALLMSNEIFMRLSGLHYQNEDEIENLEQAIKRSIYQDKDAQAFNDIAAAKMVLYKEFIPREE